MEELGVKIRCLKDRITNLYFQDLKSMNQRKS